MELFGVVERKSCVDGQFVEDHELLDVLCQLFDPFQCCQFECEEVFSVVICDLHG